MKYTPEQARKLWTDALRSNEYAQTEGYLICNGSYCCLGVACEVFRKFEGEEFLEKQPHIEDDPDAYDEDGDALDEVIAYGDDCTTVLPPIVADWLGLSGVDGVFDIGIDGHTTLMGLNDGAGYPFSKIADVIDSNPEGLWQT